MRALALVLLFLILPAVSAIPYKGCYQESPNVANQTGKDGCNVNILDYRGTFSNNSIVWNGNPLFANDGIYNKTSLVTSTQLDAVTGEIYFTYIKPLGANRSLTNWSVANGDVTGSMRRSNFTLPASCWNYNPSTLNLRALTSRWYTTMSWQCRNSTGWQTLYTESTFYYMVYDEGMYWGGDTFIPNLNGETRYEGEKHQIYDQMRITGASINTFVKVVTIPLFGLILVVCVAIALILIVRSSLSKGLLNSFNKR